MMPKRNIVPQILKTGIIQVQQFSMGCYKASSVTSSYMGCKISMLHIGYISATDHLSVFVHTERLDKMKL